MKKQAEVSDATKLKGQEMLRIANAAVLKAKAGAKAVGLAIPVWLNGRVQYELPDGTITDQKPA